MPLVWPPHHLGPLPAACTWLPAPAIPTLSAPYLPGLHTLHDRTATAHQPNTQGPSPCIHLLLGNNTATSNPPKH